MSIRTWQVPASAAIDLESGRYPVVTQDDLIKAVVDGAIMVDHAGGVLAVVTQRIPTGVPNEYVTTGALVTWQDRTNAKPQPEPSALADVGHAEPFTDLRSELTPSRGETVAAPPSEGSDSSVLDDGLKVDPDAVDESDPSLAGLR